ncbi:hypothetical protein [Paraburkholderia metrosideri]|jgi:hypothetical protein|uniref:hypothetical protein n=1 Tax=Paraburkholderia metrosideri TaxID=580937 RepID=UPI0019184A5E|nr:hypothetical protein [Paraburkholderia metrosideri]
MDFNLLGDAAWAAKRCCLGTAGAATGGRLRTKTAVLPVVSLPERRLSMADRRCLTQTQQRSNLRRAGPA